MCRRFGAVGEEMAPSSACAPEAEEHFRKFFFCLGREKKAHFNLARKRDIASSPGTRVDLDALRARFLNGRTDVIFEPALQAFGFVDAVASEDKPQHLASTRHLSKF